MLFDVLNGTVPLTPRLKRKFKKHKSVLRQLAYKRVSQLRND
jgi:hypothetical protein